MPTLISLPSRVAAAGNKAKLIDEYIGRVNSKNEDVSVAHAGAEYLAVCIPAFSMKAVHRDSA